MNYKKNIQLHKSISKNEFKQWSNKEDKNNP